MSAKMSAKMSAVCRDVNGPLLRKAAGPFGGCQALPAEVNVYV
jgi:hypothetical protein